MSPLSHKEYVQIMSCVLLIWRYPCMSYILASESSSKYIIQMHHEFQMCEEKTHYDGIRHRIVKPIYLCSYCAHLSCSYCEAQTRPVK